MRYVIIETIIKKATSDGDVLLVKANPVKDTTTLMSRVFGTRFAQFSQTESDETAIFAFPYSDEMANEFSAMANSPKKQESFWEPDEEDFVEDTIVDSHGEEILVNKSIDLIPEYDMNDFVPLDEFWGQDDDEDEEEDDYDEELMYEDDLFDVDDSEETVTNSSIRIDEDDNPEDIFNDFYSDEQSSNSVDTKKRYSEEEIKKMSVEERHEECSRCSKAKNLGGLIDFYTYFFLHGCQAMNETVIPAISYLYGRAKDVDTLNDLMQKYMFCIIELSQDSREVAQNLVRIGVMFPFLSDEQINYLESLYNNPKYCEIMDDILFDKEKLPRKISGITKNELKKTNDSFSIKLLKQTYNSFILNQWAQNERDDEYTEYYVYVRRNNNIIKKAYGKKGAGEYVLDGTLDMKSFLEYVEPKYGKECADFFANKVLQEVTWYNAESLRRPHTWVDWDLLTDIAKEFFNDDQNNLDNIKLDMALLYLRRLNERDG